VSRQPSQPLGRRLELDGVRGVAIVMVVAHHAGLCPGGYLAVDVFFTLSGFLITTLLLEEWSAFGSIDFKRFYIRRALRLLPLMYAFVACVTAYVGLRSFEQPWPAGFFAACASSVLYYSNWLKALSPELLFGLGITWSLSVEEQYYMLWPPLLALALWRRVAWKALFFSVVAVTVAVATWRLALFQTASMPQELGETVRRIYFGFDTRLDAILVGGLLAMAVERYGYPSKKVLAWAAGAAVLFLALAAGGPGLPAQIENPASAATWRTLFLVHGGFTLVALATASLLAFLVAYPKTIIHQVTASPVLVWLGKRSYGIYLFHQLVYEIVSLLTGTAGLTPAEHWLGFAAKAAFVLVVAEVLARTIELPCLAMKDRWGRRVRPSDTASPEAAPHAAA
jgi:peptidoglycan/LPS O-acetylase OafA/YrhL